jgi:hypothetical protein
MSKRDRQVWNIDLLLFQRLVVVAERHSPCYLPQEYVGENTSMASTKVIAGTNIIFSNPLTAGHDTDVLGINISNLVVI